MSLFSIANAVGRLLAGFFPETRLRRAGTPRTAFLVLSAAATAAVALWAAFARLQQLYALSVVAGFVFGAHWSLVPAITADIFGLKSFGTNYTLVQVGC